MTTVGVAFYLRWADELEYQHNLIAFSVGFLFNISAFITWFLLSMTGTVGYPDSFALFLSSAAVATLAYGWMKLKAYFA
jgi:hypothetical protein